LPAEIAQAVSKCCEAGASIAHLHARNPDGTPTQDADTFRHIIREIRDRCDIIIQVSTGGAVGMPPGERLAPVTLRPEMATLTTGSVNFGDDVFLNSPQDIRRFARKLKECGVKPEIEVFDTGMIGVARRLIIEGLLTPPLHFDLVMGVPGGISGTVKSLVQLVDMLPVGSTWTVAGIGSAELPLAVTAILLGGHVRVGFEDNIYYSKGVLATSNDQLVQRIVRISSEIGRSVATPAEARKMLGLTSEEGAEWI
jgi:3-keto-5-aminohexanoate cleavage enzyme